MAAATVACLLVSPAALVSALATVVAHPTAASAQTAHGVFVGINDYVAFDDEPGGDLKGAETDAQLMRDVLVGEWGLPEANTRTLLSREATKEAIRAAITDFLARAAGPEDVSIFYFAGHGAQAFDLDGDEPDGLDETLAPTDILRESTERDIRDDELRAWLSTVPGRVVVILDSCHSGTATRGTGPMRARILGRDIPSEGGREPDRVRQRPDPESMADGSVSIIEIAAAAPNQSAMEGEFLGRSGTQHRGAFTFHLVEALRDAPASSTYEDLVDRVATELKRSFLVQDPQVSGPGSEPIFGRVQSKAVRGMPSPPAGDPLGGVGRAGLTVNVEHMPDGPTLDALHSAFGSPGPVRLVTFETTTPDTYLRPNERGDSVQVLWRDGSVRASISNGGDAPALIRAALARELLSRQLAALRNRMRPFAVDLAQKGGRRSVTAGDRMVVDVSSERAGYLTLIDLAPTGVLTLLQTGSTASFVEAGSNQTAVVAELGSRRHGPGWGFLLALVTPSPMELDAEPAQPVGPALVRDLVRQIQDGLDRIIRDAGSHATWSSSLLAYEVRSP